LILDFWNKMVGQTGSLCHAAFRADIRLAFTHKAGWVSDVLDFLTMLGFEGVKVVGPHHGQVANMDALVDYYAKLKLPVENLKANMAKALQQMWETPGVRDSDPRSYHGPPGTIKACWYATRMGLPPGLKEGEGETADDRKPDWGNMKPLSHTTQPIGRVRAQAIMQIRLGTGPFENNRPAGRERDERTCPICYPAWKQQRNDAMAAETAVPPSPVEDEQHVVLECTATQAARDSFADRLPFDRGMLAVMTVDDTRLLGDFFIDVRSARLACHQQWVDGLKCQRCAEGGSDSTMRICSFCHTGWHVPRARTNGNCMSAAEAGNPSYWQAWKCPECT
jgi:hypothetical protein